jgi:hypothetical protein
MDPGSTTAMEEGRIGALLGGAGSSTSDKKGKKKRNADAVRTYRFNVNLKSVESSGKEVSQQCALKALEKIGRNRSKSPRTVLIIL